MAAHNPPATIHQPPGINDIPTVIGIALVAYAVANVVHEGLGHGGACLLSGGQPLVLSTVHFECSADNRLVFAGGTIANFIAGAIALVVGRSTTRSVHLRYFWWLFMTINLLQGAGYFLYSGVANVGDWSQFIENLKPVWVWRTALVILGAALYIDCIRRSLVELVPLLPKGMPERWQQARKLNVVPYIAGGIQSCLAGLLNPVGMVLVAISAAAASFGGTSGLAWMWNILKNPGFPKGPLQFGPIVRRPGWIVAGAVVALVFIGVIGPGVRFR